MRSGRTLLLVSIFSRASVVLLLCFLALMTEYLNLKLAYNHSDLVQLSEGGWMKHFYEFCDSLFSKFGEPLAVGQTNGGMTWSIRLMGIPFTDPIAFLSIFMQNYSLESGFAFGVILPVLFAVLFGRVFCSYICPASLLFFSISRIRKLLLKFFYFPEWKLPSSFSWGLLVGGLIIAVSLGHGIWMLILPYFALGQTLFHGIAYGTLSVALGSVILFSLLDLLLGKQFTCRNLCPTGRLLGALGKSSIVSIQRDSNACIESCQSCIQVCPFGVRPKEDETVNCSLCGECLVACPSKCLKFGIRKRHAKV